MTSFLSIVVCFVCLFVCSFVCCLDCESLLLLVIRLMVDYDC